MKNEVVNKFRFHLLANHVPLEPSIALLAQHQFPCVYHVPRALLVPLLVLQAMSHVQNALLAVFQVWMDQQRAHHVQLDIICLQKEPHLLLHAFHAKQAPTLLLRVPFQM